MRVLALDTETGGLDPRCNAIVSLGAVVWSGGAVVAEKEWLIADAEGTHEDAAMRVNGYTREMCIEQGQGALSTWLDFRGFVHTHCDTDPRRVVPVGHNVAFDIGFIQRLARLAGETDPRVAVEGLIGRRPLDTMVVARFFQFCGILPAGLPCSLAGLLTRYLPELGPQRHTALDDARRTAMLLDKLEDELHHTARALAFYDREHHDVGGEG